MGTRLILLAALALPANPALSANAQDPPRTRPAQKAAQTRGQVKSIDATAGKVTLSLRTREGAAEKTFDLDKDVKVTSQGQAKSLDDLKAGAAAVLTLKGEKVVEIEVRTR
jgi:Cu/Ag efflux protein CusF